MNDDSINDITNILTSDDDYASDDDNKSNDDDLADDVLDALGISNNNSNNIKEVNPKNKSSNSYDDWLPDDDAKQLYELEEIDSLI